MILGIKSSLLLTINHIINTIDDSHVWVCVSDKVKNVNVEVFDLISRVSDVWVCVSDKVKNVNVEVFDLISRVSEIQHELCVCVNTDWMIMCVIQIKNGIMMNADVSVKN